LTTLYACRDPRGDQWQLGPLPPAAGTFLLLGWRDTPPDVDDGVSETVAQVLASALTAIARVTFLSSKIPASATPGWTAHGADLVRVLHAGAMERLSAFFHRWPADMALVSTRSASSAAALFDDPGFPWWMQGQLALLSDAAAAPPDVDRATLLAMLQSDWTQHAVHPRHAGVSAVIRPGVDGDVAGVLCLETGLEERLLAALEAASRDARCEWRVVTEEELGALL
jgi:hypothetical protein